MPRREFICSGYQAMWVFAMFDLPVKTKPQRRHAAQFRKVLLREVFSMLQYSVYARFCPTQEATQSFLRRIQRRLPPGGQVRLLTVTDRQFGKMQVFQGIKCVKTETAPEQMTLF